MTSPKVVHHHTMAPATTAAPASRNILESAIQTSSCLKAKSSEDLSSERDEFRIVSMARIGKIDGELGRDARRALAQNNNPGTEQQRLLDIVGHENRREASVAPQREKLSLQGKSRQRVELAQRLV